jgi:hypothetical protein
MKRLIFILIIFQSITVNAQSFEGKLTYKLEYKIDSLSLSKFKFSEKLSSTFYKPEKYNQKIVYHFKDSMYKRNGYEIETSQVIYNGKTATLYEFFTTGKGKKRVKVIDAKIKFGTGETASGKKIPVTINEIDSTKIINGIKCRLITLDMGKFGKEEYWFNSDTLKINALSFSNHNFEYLNRILSISGSFPIQMIKITDNFGKITLTLEKVEDVNISNDIFKIPDLIEMKDKDAREFNKILHGIKYMDIR